ncbi:GTPase-activating protein [Alteromonas sediminis]|uniref:GTPase-activating protein n=1 Tax=Alteromonas sediminis TaxID=2259342 RepID=A0A3N5Y7J9_9ALTE|nr:Der GTPase-activating protein YihI [Alteromonas sediminis]RPJ66789.1 GTPase-activating protein [Alteromonas sediminis]
MPRQKKTRKIGQIGTPKSSDRHVHEKTNTRTKKKAGRPSGSRNNMDKATQNKPKANHKSTDPRHGSKRLIALTQEIKRYATPNEELAAIEADNRLSTLLDKAERGEALNKAQQAYVDEKLKRHAILCDMLGISAEQEEDSERSDPFDKLDAISMQDFVEPDKQ